MSRSAMVDPQFPSQLRTLRRQRRLSLRDFAKLAMYSHNPRHLDLATIDALVATLAHQRRLEDIVGAGLLVEPTRGQLSIVERLVPDVPDRLHRTMVGVAAQWAQFAGWLYEASGDAGQATRWYSRAMDWGTEIGDADMMATALSMRGHLAWTAQQYAGMLTLSQSALWIPAGAAVRAIAKQQEARAFAVLGDPVACDERLNEAEELAHQAFEHPEQAPAWLYFYEPDFFTLQRGLAQYLLQRNERAVELLTLGLDRVTPEVRRSEWIGRYLCKLAAAHAAIGNRATAADLVHEVRDIATGTGAAQLLHDVERIARELGL